MISAKLLLRRCAINLVALAILAFAGGSTWARGEGLEPFARSLGLRDIAAFVETIEALDRTQRLPARYVTKDEAGRLGWRPGADLWKVAPGKSIGGDRFGNREGLLPSAAGRRFFEADLDYAGGSRGAKRLVWNSDGRQWVTVDHYRSFHEVPK
ncbi:MAG: ribonuclease [Alphaproteobacteria bacterium]|nr:ribonuclease [Alphaproteobacteria bacterium]